MGLPTDLLDLAGVGDQVGRRVGITSLVCTGNGVQQPAGRYDGAVGMPPDPGCGGWMRKAVGDERGMMVARIAAV